VSTIPVPENKSGHNRASETTVPILDSDWVAFPSKAIPKKPETEIDIDRLEQLISLHEGKLLDQEILRAKRTVDYLRNGAPALQFEWAGFLPRGEQAIDQRD
jgi:hypothetical protein